MDPDLYKAVSEQLPPFNRYLLIDFPREQINSGPDRVGTTIAESTRMLKDIIQYKGYTVLSPEERALHEITKDRGGSPILISEMILVKYDLSINNSEHSTMAYFPYLKENCIIINGTKYALQLGLTEKLFSRTSDGIMTRVVKQPIQFRRYKTFKLIGLTTPYVKPEFIVSLPKLHNRQGQRKDVDLTIIHYLLARFGYTQTLTRFGIKAEEAVFVKETCMDDNHEYFAAKKFTSEETMIYLKVHKDVLEDDAKRKFIANVLYTVTHWKNHSIDNLYDASGSLFRTMMGEIIFKEVSEAQARNHADTHLESVDLYLDPITQRRMASFGLAANDIYDLMETIFRDIDKIMTTTSHQDLWDKRATYDPLFTETLIATYNRSVYNINTTLPKLMNNQRGSSKIGQRIRLRERGINDIRKTAVVIPSPQIFGDCWLVAYGNKKVRLNGPGSSASKKSGGEVNTSAPEYRYHPSSTVIETAVGFPGHAPGITGLINPWVEISKEGGFVKPAYAAEIDAISEYLPHGV